MNAIQDASPGAIYIKEVADALMVITSMVLLMSDSDEEWTDDGLQILGEAFGKGMTSTLINMHRARREGMPFPLETIGKVKH
jgi:hypothetical protein